MFLRVKYIHVSLLNIYFYEVKLELYFSLFNLTPFHLLDLIYFYGRQVSSNSDIRFS